VLGILAAVEEVRRDGDGELCGYAASRDGRWQALTVFGAVLSEHDDRAATVNAVLGEGLRALAERWTLHRPDGTSEVVCIQEARPGSATLSLGYYPEPGVPTVTITADQLASGDWAMTR